MKLKVSKWYYKLIIAAKFQMSVKIKDSFDLPLSGPKNKKRDRRDISFRELEGVKTLSYPNTSSRMATLPSFNESPRSLQYSVPSGIYEHPVNK